MGEVIPFRTNRVSITRQELEDMWVQTPDMRPDAVIKSTYVMEEPPAFLILDDEVRSMELIDCTEEQLDEETMRDCLLDLAEELHVFASRIMDIIEGRPYEV